MRQLLTSLPAVDDAGRPQIILRDGSVAGIRVSTRADITAIRRFFLELSPLSRYLRFLGVGTPSDSLVEQLSDSSDPRRNLTLIAERVSDGALRIIGAASYTALAGETAEVAFAVADPFQGKGIGTALLERLAAHATPLGFRRFQATTLADNVQMLEVFRDSGFELTTKSAHGETDVQLSLDPSAAAVAAEEGRDRLATAASIRPLLEPKSVAVVGASRDRPSIGRRVLEALIAAGFKGPLYPVHPHATNVAGLRAFSSARHLPPQTDLAVLAVPAPAVLAAVDDCAAAGVKSLVVITAGFAEAGAEGRKLQQQLTDKVRGFGMRMVGPNCMGVLNATPSVHLNASFSPIFPPGGHIGLLSQSGALGLAILRLASDRGLGISTFVSVGNKADVSGNDLLQYWESDLSTRVLLLYLESFGNPRRFARLARRIGKQKPIVAVKSGRTRAGSRAASSHTAALAASDTAVDALFHQAGVIRADTLDEMFDLAACLEGQPLPNGRRVGIVTNAGGPGILAADACEAAGLTLPDFTPETRLRLGDCLPAIATINNPVDMIASAGPEQYRRTIETVLSAAEIDALLVIFTPVEAGTSDQILGAIRDGVASGRRAESSKKPVLACVMAESGRLTPIEVADERIPTYAFPENAARTLGKVATYSEWRAQSPGLRWTFDDLDIERAQRTCREALARPIGGGWLTDQETRQVLSAFGLPIVHSVIVHTADDAASAANAIGFPVAAKLSSTRVQHKTDAGAVRLNLADAEAVRTAFEEIIAIAETLGASASDGLLIQPMLNGGVDVMMGIIQDPLFGPLIAFGLGGIHVEILKDVRFRIAPLTDRDVDELLREIKGLPLLQGYRGHPPADLDGLREMLLRLSRLADELPEIAELDLNPVMALAPGRGCHIVDARVRLTGKTRV